MRLTTKVFASATLAMAVTSLWLWQSRLELLARVDALELRLKASGSGASPASAPSPNIAEPATLKPTAKAREVPIPASPEDPAARELEVREHLRAEARRQREMLRDPAYRKANLDTARRRFAGTRADAIRVVGMTPEQADRVIDLWVERNMRYMELGEGMPGEPLSVAAQAELKRANDTEQTELRTLLGQEKYEHWGRYLASGEERGEVGQFRAQLASGAEPLRESQADALVDAIYSERQRRSSEYEEYVTNMGITDRNVVSPQDRQRWLDLEKEANQRIHASVAGQLSNTQLASLDEMLAVRLAPVEAALRLQLEGKLAKSN
jgi:hypothetical protein